MMNCIWGVTWHSRYLYHSWLFWLLATALVSVTLAFLFNHWRRKQQPTCSECQSPVEAVYLRCPECGQELKTHCPRCHHIVDSKRQCCPHCKEALHPEAKEETPGADISSA